MEESAFASMRVEAATVIACSARAGEQLAIISGGFDDGNTYVVKLRVGSPVSCVAVTFDPDGAYPFNSLVHTVRSIPPKLREATEGKPEFCT